MQLALNRVTYTHPAAHDPILNSITIASPVAGPACWATTDAESPHSRAWPAACWHPIPDR